MCVGHEFSDVEIISKKKYFSKLSWGPSCRSTYCFYDKKLLAWD